MIKLIQFKKNDIPLLLEILKNTDARFLLQFGGPRYRFPLDKKQLLETLEANDTKVFKLVDSKTGDFLGHCQLIRIDLNAKSASIGRVLLDPAFRGRGLGKKMIEELICYSQNNLGLKELDLRVYDFNNSAYKCYKSIGFIETSRQSNYFESIDETWCSISMKLNSSNSFS